MSDIGKNKESNTQIFVRNLSYQVTEEDLLQCFQEFGPVKNCTVAMHNGKPKGFGFIKFALEEDARAALSARQSFPLRGRSLKLEVAVKAVKQPRKALASTAASESFQAGEGSDLRAEVQKEQPLEGLQQPSKKKKRALSPEAPAIAKKAMTKSRTEVEGKKGSPEPESEPDPAAEAGPSRQRQLLVLGLPADVSKKGFQQFLLHMKGLRRGSRPLVELIKESHELCGDLRGVVHPAGKVLLVTAASRSDAATLKAGLEGNPAALKVLREYSQAHRTQEQGDPSRSGPPAAKKGERLVLRPLTALTAPDLRKRRGRVIVRNLSFEATERNVADKLGRFGPLVSVEVPKVAKAEAGAAGAKMRPRGFAFVTFLCEQDAVAAVKESAAATLKVCNREVAVDLCLSKESYVKEGARAVGTAAESSEDGAGSSGERQQDDADEEDEVDSSLEQEDEDEEEEQEQEGGGEAAAAVPVRRAFPAAVPVNDVSEGLTVFLRDLPFDCSAAAVSAALGSFGPLAQAAVLVPNKGSAFAKFRDRSSVEKCLAAARAGTGLSIDGRCCRVDLAVDRLTAQRLGQEQRPRDKRNLYLAAVEGAAVEPAGAGAGAGAVDSDRRKAARDSKDTRDRDKRLKAQAEKRKKLQNPLFFVSGQRLSVRNLGRDVSDQQLRTVALRALKAALAGNKVLPRDLEAFVAAQGRELAQAANAGVDPMQVPAFSPKAVRSVKVMRETGKGPGDLLPRSKGFGFVEFGSHAHALAVLREMDGNGKYSEIALDGRPIVEFTIENIRKVKILEERKQRSQERLRGAAETETAQHLTAVRGRGLQEEAERERGGERGGAETHTAAAETVRRGETPQDKKGYQHKNKQNEKRERERVRSQEGSSSSSADKRRRLSAGPAAAEAEAEAEAAPQKEKKKLSLRQRELLKQRQRKEAKRQKQERASSAQEQAPDS